MKALLIGVGLAAIVTPALADFYIIQEPTTKRCRVVEERPAPNAGIIIGCAPSKCARRRQGALGRRSLKSAVGRRSLKSAVSA
jgi:hypothetical protein